MRHIAVIVIGSFLLFTGTAYAQKKPKPLKLTEGSNPPLQLNIIGVEDRPEVCEQVADSCLDAYVLAYQSFNKQKKDLRLFFAVNQPQRTSGPWLPYPNAAMVIALDGQPYRGSPSWTLRESYQGFWRGKGNSSIAQSKFTVGQIRTVANAPEVWISVMPDAGQLSWKLTDQQLAAMRMVVARYDALEGSNQCLLPPC